MDLLGAVKMRQARKDGRTARELAVDYGVDVSHVHSVLRGDSYATQIVVHVDDETYLLLHRNSKKSRKSIQEHASEILHESARRR